MRTWIYNVATICICLSQSHAIYGNDLGKQTTTQWAPFVEWSLENPDWQGNPFDVVAWATIKHAESKETRRTQMFFAGDKTWKFRFTGTRVGNWTFTTSSSDRPLDGHRGTILVKPNPNPSLRGFITHKGNRFAKQVSSPDDLEGFLPNTYMNQKHFGNPEGSGWIDITPTLTDPKKLHAYMDEVEAHGCNGVFMHVNNQWFKAHVPSYNQHMSENPDFETFSALEKAIVAAHARGLYIHIWAWGDQARKWTPVGVGGINGQPDRRLQRYIAARLGPLPGWVMGYGFDLQEWASEKQLETWADYLHEHMGWRHMLWGRGRSNPELDAVSYSGYDVRDYKQIVKDLNSDLTRPHLYEERHTYLRNKDLSMEGTRQFRWHMAMAGGMMGFWGHYPKRYKAYPEPQQLKTHNIFWNKKGRFRLDLKIANELSDGYALKTPNNRHFIFYKEETERIQLNLSSMPAPQKAIAVDAKLGYKEIELGMLQPKMQTVQLPHQSDWAIAVGGFGKSQE